MISKKLLITAGFFLLVLISYFYREQALSTRFVDEEDNFAIGKYVSQGEKIYKDIISNHQPFTYILSSQVENISHPSNGYFLLMRHREFIIAWSAVWSLILIFNFGLAALIFILFYELSKIHLFGNLFLAESLAVYPVIFLIGAVFEKKLTHLQTIICGIAFGLSVFFLSPIWPFLFFILIILLLKKGGNFLNFSKYFLLGFLLPTLITFSYTSIPGLFYYTLFVNFTYTLPNYQNEPTAVLTIKSFLTPFLSLAQTFTSPTLIVIKIYTVTLLVAGFVNFKLKQYKRLALVVIILGLLNLRYTNPGLEGYSGFHLLPWYAAFIFLTVYLLILTFGRSRSKLNILCWILIGLSFIQIIRSSENLLKKTDKIKSYEINYSSHLSIGDSIKVMRNKNDTLFVSPNAWLVYWQSDTNHLPGLYVDYTWISAFQPITQKIDKVFQINPPTFFYCENCKGLKLENYLSKYQMARKNNMDTHLYVLKDKVSQLSKEQLKELSDNYQMSF